MKAMQCMQEHRSFEDTALGQPIQVALSAQQIYGSANHGHSNRLSWVGEER
jgi:hypothetical protein